MNILGIIPARGGSKGIPKKNIYSLLGKPLIGYTIEAARQSRMLSRAIVSTDSQEIADVARELGGDVPFLRPAEFAQDATPAMPYIEHALTWLRDNEGLVPDYVVLLQPTSPLRTARHIDECLQTLLDSGADSIVSVVQAPHNCIPQSLMTLEEGVLKPFMQYDESLNQRQKKPVYYARNGPAIAAVSHECLKREKRVYAGKTMAYEMAPEESFDIDTLFDMRLCAWLLSERAENS